MKNDKKSSALMCDKFINNLVMWVAETKIVLKRKVMWEDVAVAWFEVLPWNLLGSTEENPLETPVMT